MRYGYFLSGRPPAEVAIIEFIWTADIWRRLAIGEISEVFQLLCARMEMLLNLHALGLE